jgi:DNA-binding CsgD family transcriptional regulator
MCHAETDPVVAVASAPRERDSERPLSPRMLQVLELILAGSSEKQMARVLGLSRHTVHVHLKSLHARFGVQTRTELMARFVPDVRGEELVGLIQRGRLLYRRATTTDWVGLCAGTGRKAGRLSGVNGEGKGRLRGHPRQSQLKLVIVATRGGRRQRAQGS